MTAGLITVRSLLSKGVKAADASDVRGEIMGLGLRMSVLESGKEMIECVYSFETSGA